MIAVDTNILIYRHRPDSPFHSAASQVIDDLTSSGQPWAITWPTIHEFLAIVTNPKVYKPASGIELALDVVESWLECPTLTVIGESGVHWRTLKALVRDGRIHGGRVHDARIAAICMQHGVTEFWTLDRDFSRFPRLRAVNPLVQK